MKESLARQISEAMECRPELLPFLPELLADLEELGGSRRVILDLLRRLNLPAGARVLDLGCGKGGVLLALAEELGFHGVGVDAFPPFIEAAQRAAQARGLADKCEFRCADLCEVVADYSDFDVSMMLALGAAIGNPKDIVGLLRSCVRPGGYMVIDDSYLAPGVKRPVPGYEGYSDHDTSLAQLTALGDTLLKEYIFPVKEVVRLYQSQTNLIRARGQKLGREHPELAGLIRRDVERQEREVELARGTVLNATWLLQRAP